MQHKVNWPFIWAGENNLLLLQATPSDENEEALAGATATVSLLSPPANNSASATLSQNETRIKCHFHQKQNLLRLFYFDGPILGDADIYGSDIPFQYNKRE